MCVVLWFLLLSSMRLLCIMFSVIMFLFGVLRVFGVCIELVGLSIVELVCVI